MHHGDVRHRASTLEEVKARYCIQNETAHVSRIPLSKSWRVRILVPVAGFIPDHRTGRPSESGSDRLVSNSTTWTIRRRRNASPIGYKFHCFGRQYL